MITGRYYKRSSRRGALSLGHPCRSDSFLGSRDLSRNRGGFPSNNPLSLGTLLGGNELGWRDSSFGRSSLGSSCRGRSHGLSHDIRSIKEALYRYASSCRSLFTHRMINKNGLGINLRKGCQSEKKDEQSSKRKEKERYIIIYDNDKEHGCMHKLGREANVPQPCTH